MVKNIMSVKSLINTKRKILESKLSLLIDHPVTKGDHCESVWIDFFRSFLPNKYAIDKGFVFDSEGNVSDQIDVIIYDTLYSPLIFGTEAGEKFITAESVYAVFDSKPNINKETLNYTNEKIETVKKLIRTSRDMIIGGKIAPNREPIEIIGGILAVNSISKITIKKYLKEYLNIDVGCAVNSTAFLALRNFDGSLIKTQLSDSDESIISFFFIILDELYKRGTVAAVDIRHYADKSLESIKLDKGGV